MNFYRYTIEVLAESGGMPTTVHTLTAAEDDEALCLAMGHAQMRPCDNVETAKSYCQILAKLGPVPGPDAEEDDEAILDQLPKAEELWEVGLQYIDNDAEGFVVEGRDYTRDEAGDWIATRQRELDEAAGRGGPLAVASMRRQGAESV